MPTEGDDHAEDSTRADCAVQFARSSTDGVRATSRNLQLSLLIASIFSTSSFRRMPIGRHILFVTGPIVLRSQSRNPQIFVTYRSPSRRWDLARSMRSLEFIVPMEVES